MWEVFTKIEIKMVKLLAVYILWTWSLLYKHLGGCCFFFPVCVRVKRQKITAATKIIHFHWAFLISPVSVKYILKTWNNVLCKSEGWMLLIWLLNVMPLPRDHLTINKILHYKTQRQSTYTSFLFLFEGKKNCINLSYDPVEVCLCQHVFYIDIF